MADIYVLDVLTGRRRRDMKISLQRRRRPGVTGQFAREERDPDTAVTQRTLLGESI